MASLAEDTALRLGAFAPAPVAIPSHFARREGEGRLNSTVLTARGWDARGFALRTTTIVGPNVEIANVLGYPTAPERVPVFAAQVILFGGRPRVAVIDLQPVWSAAPDRAALDARLDRSLAPIAAAFADIPPAGELPEWCRDAFTRHALFTRPPADAPWLDRVVAAYGAFLDAWREDWLAAPPPPEPAPPAARAEALAALARYRRSHREGSPGLPYLERAFGAAWTDAYLREFMYA